MSVIEEAIRLVHGARQASYGRPIEDFTRTGRMWGAILGIPDVSPRKVALCMIALKVSREAFAHKDDTLIDIAGYAETLALIVEDESVTEATVTESVTAPVTVAVTANSSSSSPSSSSASASKQSTASTAHAREDYPTTCPKCAPW